MHGQFGHQLFLAPGGQEEKIVTVWGESGTLDHYGGLVERLAQP